MRKYIYLFLILCCLSPHLYGGNVTGNCTSYSQEGRDVTFHLDDNSAVQLQLCSPSVVRVWFSPDGKLQRGNPSFAVINEELEDVGTVRVDEQNACYEIFTPKLRIRVNKAPFSLQIFDKYQKLLFSDYADKGHISRQGAKAFKARVLLYEATWRKYNGTSTDFEGSSGPSRDQINEFLDEAIALAKSVMDDPAFRLWNYNGEDVMKNLSNRYLFCIESADSNPGKHGRDTNQEFILYSVFDKDANAGAIELNKNILPYIYPTRKFIDMFVCTNGLPIAGNEQFKGYHNMGDEFQNRDYRMNSYVGAPTTVIKLSGTIGFGGYGVQKFMCPGTKDKEESANYPVLRLAEVYLIYAEALMERHGSITDEELNVSINKLRGRAGVASLTNKQVTDHQLDMLEEIRRERAVELFLEGFRYDDLKRWGVLESMLNQSRLGMVVGDPGYRTPYKDASGSVITDAYDNKSYRYGEEQTTTGDGELSCVLLAPKSTRHLRKAHYLYPIPQNQINLNPNLKQNPGYN